MRCWSWSTTLALSPVSTTAASARASRRAHLCEWAQAHHARYGFAHWAVETREDAAFIGTLGLLCRETLPVPHLGFALLPAYRGKGYVTEAGRAVLDYARDVLGLSQLCAIVSPDNAESIRALEKLGLQQHGLRVLSRKPRQCCITRSILGLWAGRVEQQA